jgi:endonuclease G
MSAIKILATVVILLITLSTVNADYLVTNRKTSVKSEPSSASGVVMQLEDETPLLLLDNGDKKNGYYKVRGLDFEGDAWIYMSFVRRFHGSHPALAGVGTGTVAAAAGGIDTPGVATQGDNMLMGNPSDANTSDNDNYLFVRTEYTVSYNSGNGIPNWVSWHLSKGWSTDLTRAGTWNQDELLPATLHQATDDDYTGSKFDRGHLCPVDDRDYSLEYMDNTFKFTNAFPQNPRTNQHGPWRKLEDYLKSLSVLSDKEIYIIAGVSGIGGETNEGVKHTALPKDPKVKVPSHCWKVALILPNGTDDARRASTRNAQIIAVYIPNTYSSDNWQQYSVSVDELEAITGYDFFEALPDEVERVLEGTAF